MGLFDFIGASSPMFMASEKRETPFRIDYDKLAPGVQQPPNWGGSKSPYKANEADIEEREQREAYAHNMMGDLVKKYGADANAITRDPQFKQISMAMSMTPEEVLRLNNRLEQDTKTKEALNKPGEEILNAVDYKTFLGTGNVQDIGATFNQLVATPTSRLQDYQQRYSDLTQAGTHKDFENTLNDAFALATGKTTSDISDILKTPDGRRKLISSVGAHYGITNEQVEHMDDHEQLNFLTRYVGEQLTGKSANFLKGQYVAQTKEHAGMALPPSLDEDGMNPALKQHYIDVYKQHVNPGVSDADAAKAANDYYKQQFQNFVQHRVSDAVGMKEEHTDKTSENFQNIGNALADEKTRKEMQQMGQIGDWLATSPVPNKDGSVSPAAAKPTGHLDGIQISVTDKKGNIVQKTIPGNFDYFTGPQYNYSFGKDGIPIEAMTRPSSKEANDEVYFGGKWQSLDNFKGLKIYKAVGASNLPTASNFTIDDFDGDKLKPSSQWKVNGNKGDGIQHYIDAEIVIPEGDIKKYTGSIEVENHDDKQSEPLLNSFVHRIVNFGTSEFNDASNGLLNRDKDGNLHLMVKVRTPNAEALNAMDNSSDKGIDKNAYVTLLQGTKMNSSEEKEDNN